MIQAECLASNFLVPWNFPCIFSWSFMPVLAWKTTGNKHGINPHIPKIWYSVHLLGTFEPVEQMKQKNVWHQQPGFPDVTSRWSCHSTPFVKKFYRFMHGLRTPRESFFSKISKFWAWADILRYLRYFQLDYQHSLWYCEFHVFNYFYKKMSLYSIYLGVWFKFGPQRIWDLAFVCP